MGKYKNPYWKAVDESYGEGESRQLENLNVEPYGTVNIGGGGFAD